MKTDETTTCDQCQTEKKEGGHVGWITIKAGLPESFHDKYELGKVNVTIENERHVIAGDVRQRFDLCSMKCFGLHFEAK